MNSYKELHINVWKEYDYTPLSKEEKERIQKILIAELTELVERFDGPVRIEVTYKAQGNC